MPKRRYKLVRCLLGVVVVVMWIAVLSLVFAYIVVEEIILWVVKTADNAVCRLEKRRPR